jgi:hypothetical protein
MKESCFLFHLPQVKNPPVNDFSMLSIEVPSLIKFLFVCFICIFSLENGNAVRWTPTLMLRSEETSS